MRDEHLSQMILARASRAPHGVAFRVRRGDAYADVPWSEVTPRLDAIAAGLLSAAALDDGACISIVGNTSMESCLVDFAALSVGLKTVPVYASLLPEEVGYMHVDTATQLVVVENAAQLAKVRALRAGFTFAGRRYAPDALAVRAKVVVIDPGGIGAAEDWESLESVEARGHARRQALHAEMRRRAARVRREDVATYTYTSGTTGVPKAVIQTHDNLLAMLEDAVEAGLVDDAVRAHGLLLFLPAAHSFGRMVEFAGPFFGAPLIMSSVPTLAADLLASRPGFFPAAPRVFEKMTAKIQSAIAGDGRNFCTAMFALDAEMLAAFAQREGVPADPSHPRIHAVLQAVVDEANLELASFERIKAFRVSPAAFTVDGGELTASLKVKRHAIAQKYAALIDGMYAQ